MSDAKNQTRTDRPSSDEELGRLKERVIEVIGKESTRSFAQKSGVGESTLRNIIDGAMPRIDILLRIAKEGGVNIHWLATGEGDKTPPPEGDKVAERLSHIKVGEDGAVYTRSSITTELKDRLKRYKHVYNEAVTAVGWQPPPAVAAAIQTMIFTEPVEIDQVVLLLEALKTEYS